MLDQSSLVPIHRKQALYATVIKACGNCGAGGVYHDVEGVNVGCYDPTRLGQPVGDACPNCGASRVADRDLGEIWHRNFYSPLPSLLRHAAFAIKGALSRLVPSWR